MPIVNISLWPGRTKEQKSQLVQAITDDFVHILNAKPESIQIIELQKKQEFMNGNDI